MENHNLENMQCIRKAISDQRAGWYVVMDKATRMEYGLFELTSEPMLAEYPTHTSHMRLIVNECIANQAGKENYRPLGKFCKYCFQSVLELTEEEGLIECRIRADDDFVLATYRIFADALKAEDGYQVSNHNKWIVIRKE